MSYSRNEGGYDNPSPWATTAPDEGNDMSKLLESLRNSAGSGTMSNLATSLVAQAVQKRPGGMLIGETHFGGQGSAPMGGPSFNNSEPHGGDRYIDRSGGRDDYPSGQGSAPMGGPSFNNSEPHGGNRYKDRSGGRDDDVLYFVRDDYPSGQSSFNNREPFGGDGYIDRSGGRDDYPRGSDNLAPLSNSSRSKPPFRRSRSRQSHCRKVPRWEIFMGQELRFWQDMGRMADFPAFIASKSFDL